MYRPDTPYERAIPDENVGQSSGAGMSNRNHGTHVMGTIGAMHNNNIGLSGVLNISRENLFSFDSFDVRNEDAAGNVNFRTSRDAQLEGLRWNVIRGVKVINFSIGSGGVTGVDPSSTIAAHYIQAMEDLLDIDDNPNTIDYDFIIIHSAGNGKFDASRNSAFSHIEEGHNLRNRIITVGAVQQNGSGGLAMADYGIRDGVRVGSNFGTMIDVVAPGHSIYSTINTWPLYASNNGTSMAAPHVAGVAALVWSENPGLNGERVKEIIVNSARRPGNRIEETRTTQTMLLDDDGNVKPLVDDFGNVISPFIPIKRPAISPISYYMVNAAGALLGARGMDPDFTQSIIIGRVECYEDGTPIANARVRTYINGNLANNVFTDENGIYRLFRFNPNSVPNFAIEVSKPWYIADVLEDVIVQPGITAHLHRLRRQDTRHFDVALVIDESGSISIANFNTMRNHTLRLVEETFDDNDRIGIITFGSTVIRHTNFTDRDSALDILRTLPRRGGSTALNNGIVDANNMFATQAREDVRRIMIVLTDGVNNVSGLAPALLVAGANAHDITIYTVGIGSVNTGVLTLLATETGGEFFHVNNFHQLEEVFENIRHGLDAPRPLSASAFGWLDYEGLAELFEMFEADNPYEEVYADCTVDEEFEGGLLYEHISSYEFVHSLY